jgi:hypothetical protein
MVHKNTRENKTFGTILSLAQALQMFSGWTVKLSWTLLLQKEHK